MHTYFKRGVKLVVFLSHWKSITFLALLCITIACLFGIRYAYVKVGEARAETVTALQGQKAALEQLKEERNSHLATVAALDLRDRERDAIQSKYQSASRELAKLRRTNAEIQAWADRPIPADVIRLLSDRADGASARDTARNADAGLPQPGSE